tara:strand:- start:5786 stop:7006 length:1221 start_codon:yes stop_codon:yes gene_type:complete
MGAIITEKMGFFNAENFISVIRNIDQMVYVFIAKDDTWGNGDVAPSPTISISREMEDSADILSMKRIFYNNVSYIVKKNSWSSGTVYSQYTDASDLSSLNYFVEDSGHVFKCISNNGGAPSTDKPTDSSPFTGFTQTTTDKYVWKYMYSIVGASWDWSNDIITNPNGQDWIPVRGIEKSTDNPDQWSEMKASISGGIHSFNITPPNDANVINHLVGLDGKAVLLNGDGANFSGMFRVNTVSANTYTFVVDTVGTSLSPGKDYNIITGVQIDGNLNDSETNPYIDYVKPIFSPQGGHGSNAVRELGGEFVLISATVDSFVGSYRKMGLIINPLRVTRSDNTSNKITHIDGNGEMVFGERVGKEDVENTTITNDYLRFSGDIIYIENLETPKTMENNSGVAIKMVLSF